MTRARTLLALLALVCAACSGGGELSAGDEEAPTTSAVESTTTSEVQESTTTSALPGGLSPVEVSLVSGEDSGGTALRLVPEEGSVEHATLTITQATDQLGIGTTRISYSIGIEATVDEVTEDGGIVSTWVYDSAELIDTAGLPPESVDLLGPSLEQIVGLSITQTTDDRGRPLEVELDLPPGLDPTVSSTMEETSNQLQSLEAPLPAEPVSEGASWEVRYPIESMGLELLTVYLYELTELDGTEYTFDVELTQSVEPGQEVEIPGSGVAQIQEFDGQGSGTVRGDLTRLLPIESSIRMSIHQVISAAGQEVVQDVSTEIDLVSD